MGVVRPLSCCLCGDDDLEAEVRYCKSCAHNFCSSCRRLYFWRTIAFLERLMGEDPVWCQGHGK